MADYIVSSDSTCDLPLEFTQAEKLGILKLTYNIDGVDYYDEQGEAAREFYNKLRNGAMPITSQTNPEAAADHFRSYLEKGMDVLHISLSSGLSGCYQSQLIARDMLLEEFPDRKIIVVDSLGAALGHGLMVYYALKLQKEGKTIEETAQWLTDNRLRVSHDVAVDDLMHLYRGGRVSKGAAIIGGALAIKPILHMDDEGHLKVCGKERGRKKALITIAKKLVANMEGHEEENDVITIGHGDCLEDAEFVRDKIYEMIKDKKPDIKFIISYIGSVVGSHSGPGTIAIFAIGKGRNL